MKNRGIILFTIILSLVSVWGCGRFIKVRFFPTLTDKPPAWFHVSGDESLHLDPDGLLALKPGKRLSFDLSTFQSGDSNRWQIQAEIVEFHSFVFGCLLDGKQVQQHIDDKQNEWLLLAPGKSISLEIIRNGEMISFAANGTIFDRTKIDERKVNEFFLESRNSSLRLRSIRLIENRKTTEQAVIAEQEFDLAGADKNIKIYIYACGFLLAVLVLELILSFVFRIRVRQLLLSWFSITALISLWFGLTAGNIWLVPLDYPIASIWGFQRLRFWLLQTHLFDSLPKQALRAVPAILGFPALLYLFSRGMAGAYSLSYCNSIIGPVVIGSGILIAFVILWRDLKVKLSDAVAITGHSFWPAILFYFFVDSAKDLPQPILSTALPLSVLALSLPLSANRNRLRHYGLLMLSLSLLVFFAFELGLRNSDAAGYLQPMDIGKTFGVDKDLFWAPKGFLAYTDDFSNADNTRVTRIRFRGNIDAPMEKKPGMIRIVTLGGSNCFGDGIADNAQTFSGLLEKRLRERGFNVEVLNGGVQGYNSLQIMVLMQKYIASFHPDLVILYLTRNDVASGRGRFTYRELWNQRESTLGKARQFLHRSLLYNGLTKWLVGMRDRIVGNWYDSSLIKETMPVDDFRENVRKIIKSAKRSGAKIIVASEFWGDLMLNFENDRMSGFPIALRETAEKYDAYYLDSANYFLQSPDPYHWLFAHDLTHFNENGHAEMARLLEEFILNNGLLTP